MMNGFHNQPQPDMHPLQRTTGLSEAYLKLEGFLESAPSKESAASTSKALMAPATQLPESDWKEACITFGVLFTYLVVSSVALGFGISKLSQGLQQLSDYAYQQSIDPISTPTRWHW